MTDIFRPTVSSTGAKTAAAPASSHVTDGINARDKDGRKKALRPSRRMQEKIIQKRDDQGLDPAGFPE